MGKVKRYVLRFKGKILFNKQCVLVLEKYCIPKMTSVRRETYRLRKKVSWRDTLDYLWKYYKKYITDDAMDLRLYHERRGCTYGSSRFKQTAALQGYKSRSRQATAAQPERPLDVPTFNLEQHNPPRLTPVWGTGTPIVPDVNRLYGRPAITPFDVALDQAYQTPSPLPATTQTREWGFLDALNTNYIE